MHRAGTLLFSVTWWVLCSLLLAGLALAEDSRSAARERHGDDAVDLGQTQVCAVVIDITDNDQYASANGLNDPSPADIAQELGISVDVVQDCLQQVGPGTPPDETAAPETTAPETTAPETTASETPTANGADDDNDDDDYGKRDDNIINVPTNKLLPRTGGPPLLGLVAFTLVGTLAGVSVLRAGLRRES